MKALPAKLEWAPPVLLERVTSNVVLVETCGMHRLKVLLYLIRESSRCKALGWSQQSSYR